MGSLEYFMQIKKIPTQTYIYYDVFLQFNYIFQTVGQGLVLRSLISSGIALLLFTVLNSLILVEYNRRTATNNSNHTVNRTLLKKLTVYAVVTVAGHLIIVLNTVGYCKKGK